MRQLLLLLSCLLLSGLVRAQTFEWVNGFDYESSTYDFDTFLKTQVDGDGNTFTAINEDTDDDEVDFHLQKRDADGTVLWTKSWGGSDIQSALATCIDHEGNIYILGRFLSTVDFDPNEGVFEVSSETLEWNFGTDLFLLKLDNDGNFLWVFTEGADADFEGIIGSNICVDKDNNVVFTGQFEGYFEFGDGHYVSITAGALSSFHDNFIVKFDADGNCLWAHQIEGGEGDSSDKILGLDTDSLNNIFIGGHFMHELDMNPAPFETEYISHTSYLHDGFILKINADGVFEWVKQIGGGYSASINSLKINTNGDLICSGFAKGETDYDPADTDYILGGDDSEKHGFILKLNTLGEFVWVKELKGHDVHIMAMDLDTSNRIYLTGYFEEEMNLSPDEILIEVSSEGSTDIFIAELSEDGDFNWGTTLGNDGQDKSGGLVLSNTSSFIITGEFQATVDFNPSPAVNELDDEGLTDRTFLLKFDQCDPVLSYDTVRSCDPLSWINGTTYTESADIGVVKHLEGLCDSVYYMNYTRFPSYDTTYSVSSCVPFSWIDGASYDSDTTVTLIFENIYGCDSTMLLDFDHIEPVVNEDVLSTCTPFTWLDGITYYDDTVLTYTITTETGCDSVWIMELIFPGIAYATNVNECYSYTWTDGNTYYSDTLVYDTIVNPFGCDSIKILNLNIHPEETLFSEVSTCVSYTWVDGITYTNDTIVTTLISDPFGCDTLATLDLEITPVDVGTTLFSDYILANAGDVIYTWIDCEDFSIIPGETNQTFYPDESGDYAVIVEMDDCIDTSTCVTFNIDDASIAQSYLDNISLFPNPGTRIFNLSLPANRNLSVKITDVNGRVIQTFHAVNDENFEFNLEVESGIYYVSVASVSETRILKLILL